MQFLNFSHNDLYTFSLPTSLQNLRQIDLSHNNIQIANFSKHENLQEIDLKSNQLNEVEIQYLPNLQKLDLSLNSYYQQAHKLKSSSLQHLDLSKTRLKNDYLDFEENLSNLTTLILAHNQITSISYLRSKSLQILDITNCDIQHLSVKNLSRFPSLITLHAGNNPKLFVNLNGDGIDLEIADFSNSGTEKVHISALKQIQTLDLSFSKIKTIGDHSFESNLKLRNLSIASNNINEISARAFKNNSILIFDVSNNSLASVKWTHSLLNAKMFNASFNKIQSLSEIYLKQAIDVDLSHNLIDSLSIELWTAFPEIQVLNLRYNRIEHVGRLQSMTLERLHLGYCKIRLLKLRTFDQLPKLNYLDLEENQLKVLNYLVLAEAQNLNKVLLGQNPWTCDCANEKFKNLFFYLIVNQTLADQNTLFCDQNKKWVEVCVPLKSSNNKLGKQFNSNAFVWVGVVFLVALAGGLGLMYCKGRKSPVLPETAPPVAVYNHPLLRTSS